MKAAFVCNQPDKIDYVYAKGRRQKIAQITDMIPEIINADNFDAMTGQLKDVEVIFSTWGMINFSDAQLDMMPALKAVFYAAGATDGFARPLLKRNISLMSAWQANAIPVAEFAAAQIILALKGFFRNSRELKTPEMWRNDNTGAFVGPGAFEETVALIGAGAIASKTRELLENYNVNVMIIPSRKERRTVSLEEAFRTAFVVSNHLPNRDDNVGVINRTHFNAMRPGAVFINTGRGAQVNEQDMIEIFKKRPDLTALLDVSFPEPPVAGSELYSLPNIHLSSHIAGSLNNEVVRMADYAIEEFLRWENGEPLKYRVTEELLMTN